MAAPDSVSVIEGRTRQWVEAGFLASVRSGSGPRRYDDDGNPLNLAPGEFNDLLRKLRIFRWLDGMRFDSFIDVGAWVNHYPALVHARYGADAYRADFAHSLNLPYAGAEDPKLDHAVTLNIERLPFRDDAFDVVLASEVLEHLVRPVECISELLRITRKYLIITSLEALAYNRWRRWLAHQRVDIRQPHVERNYLLLSEFDAIFGPNWQHESLMVSATLPAPFFAPPPVATAAHAGIQSRPALIAALCRAAADRGHPSGGVGILLVKSKGDAPPVRPSENLTGLAAWLIDHTVEIERAGQQVAAQLRRGSAPLVEVRRPIANALLDLVRCPDCRGCLERTEVGVRCVGCTAVFAGEYGVPILHPTRATDRGWPMDEWLPRLSGGDRRRARTIGQTLRRLRRNELPPSRLRRALWRVMPT